MRSGRLVILCCLAALAGGCNSDERAPEMRLDEGAPPERSSTTLVAALGDSITAGSPRWDPDERVLAELGPAADRRSQYEYWAQRRMPGFEFRNCGVFGEETDEIARRLEGCAKDAGALIVQGGINDIAHGVPVTEAAANLRAMVLRGKQLGLRTAVAEVLPWNNGGARAAPQIRRLNRLIAAIGRDEEVSVLPWYERLEDPASPGRMKREWTIDGDHPSVAGYRRLAEVVELP
jgi:lysophospholipase L1-like esterase